MSRPRIVVFYGGSDANRDLSSETGSWVCQYIPRGQFDVTPVEVTADGKWRVPLGNLPRTGPVGRTMKMLSKAVRPLAPAKALERLLYRPVHGLMTMLRGKGGDDGSLHSLASMLEVPLVGSPQRACQLASDKFLFSQAVEPVATVPYTEPLWVQPSNEEVVAELQERFMPPFFVKSACDEGSAGICYVDSLERLGQLLNNTPRRDLFIQERVPGTELSLTLVEDDKGKLLTLPPTVVIPGKADFYDHLAKRRPGRVKLHTREMKDNPVVVEAEQVARDVYQQLGCRGMATVDMIAEGDMVHVLEVNTVPTLSRSTPLAWQLKSSGLHPTRMLDGLIRRSLEEGN